jgi:hypothetical protein
MQIRGWWRQYHKNLADYDAKVRVGTWVSMDFLYKSMSLFFRVRVLVL